MWFIVLALIVCYGVACYFSNQLIVKVAMDKGYEDQRLKLTFIIVFATPASAAMIVAALPDKRLQTSVSDNPVLSTIDAELPKL